MLYENIISIENIKKAYLATVSKFEAQLKTNSYSGFDGLVLSDYNHNSLDMVYQIRKELVDLREIDPAIKMLIPKNNKPGKRTIFIHSIKERVKARAIYQIIEPIIDKYLSDFLFSYRSSHPHYKAATSVAKRYRKNYKEDYILIGDISDYCDNIDKDILMKKIKNLSFDEKTNELIKLFINNSFIEGGDKKTLDKGLVHGQPLISIFYNIYVDDIDKAIGKKVSLYRRVGDDFILVDKNLEKINEQREFLINKLIEYNIPKDKQKIMVIKANQIFDFLGYTFNNGLISLSKRSEKKIKDRWKKRLKYYPGNNIRKTGKLKDKMSKTNPFPYEFIEIIKNYSQVNDLNQIKKLSDYFFRKLTVYYYGSYNNRNHRLTREITSKIKIPSIYKYFIDIHTGRKSFNKIKKEV
jgi:hypothetical protein